MTIQLNHPHPNPIPTNPDDITLDDLTNAFRAQLFETAETCLSALRYYSDSVVDPVNSAADALSALNNFYYDSDLDGFRRWLTDAENGANSYCSEGLTNLVFDFLTAYHLD